MIPGPFDLRADAAWRAWRERKLALRPESVEALLVEVADLANPTPAEEAAIRERVARANMALFATPRPERVTREVLRSFAARFGLRRLDHNEGADEDGVTVLRVVDDAQWRRTYIPYTNRPIHWHTDGYYNTPEAQIRSLMLYCERPAAEGGENALLDHELAYLHLRERDPALVAALMHPQAMTIPANRVADHIERPDRPGPVFSVDRHGHLHMRYTKRQRNVVWRDDEATRAARAALENLLDSDSPWILRATLQRGQGLVCNNVLHDRSGFTDHPGQTRLLYRLRFHDRMT